MKISNSLLLLGAVASGILQVAALDVLVTTGQSLVSANDKLCITIGSCSYNCANFAAMPKSLTKPSNPSCSSASYPGSFAVAGAPGAPLVGVDGKALTCVKKKESGTGTITREFVCSYTPPAPTCNNKATIFGKKKKNGVLNDCCETSNDCLGDCTYGKCGAPPATCTNKATIFGKKKKNGVLNDCCETTKDCKGDCISGKCGAPPATCTNKATIFGKKKKNGVLNDCCETTKDCKGDCVSGKCGAPPATCTNKATIFGKKKKNGVLNDCCETTKDCKGDCVSGKCGKPATTEKCTNKSYFGKRNGSGPNGVCCRTERDCKEDCRSGVCT
ncbi:hypothetical protein MBANPS3_011472, partial [Mucor bainieri]